MTLCPEGEAPWVLVRVQLRNTSGRPRRIEHVERWAVVPQFVNIGARPEQRADHARAGVRFRVESHGDGLAAVEERTPEAAALQEHRFPRVFGPELTIVLEPLGETAARAMRSDAPHPILALASEVVLEPGGEATLWFRFGAEDGTVVGDPAAVMADSMMRLKRRLPRAASPNAAEAEREIPWHAAILSGGACRDEVLGHHTLNQGSAYAYRMGFNGAARDPLQHAMPLVYIEPDLALSVLRNTCSWATPDGDMPYALDGAKRLSTELFQPSDQNLWALWLARRVCGRDRRSPRVRRAALVPPGVRRGDGVAGRAFAAAVLLLQGHHRHRRARPREDAQRRLERRGDRALRRRAAAR